jgi:glycosyltransferase involved in cell wall biosynthesis
MSAPHETVLLNAPDNTIFNDKKISGEFSERKIRLISSSWSTNALKGFAMLEWLDAHLDFNRYDFTFVGNSPVKFKHIRMHPPVDSEHLAPLLKQHDVYVFTSRIEACSNALIEALSCGLPALAPNSTSNPEVVQGGGELFNSEEDILEKLSLIVENYESYRKLLPTFQIEEVARQYAAFGEKIYTAAQGGSYLPKEVTPGSLRLFFALKRLVWQNKIKGAVRVLKKYLSFASHAR